MRKTPKSLRLQIGIFGRTNVGKSSFLNLIVGQEVAITSSIPGTTTDVVEKSMELLPIGPVVFLDTAGLDDSSSLGEKRIKKTKKIFERADVIVLLTESEIWGEYENYIVEEAKKHSTPLIIAINKIDIKKPSSEFKNKLSKICENIIEVCSLDWKNKDKYINEFKKHLIRICPKDFLHPPPLIGDLLPPGGVAVLIVPIDLQAPKGRLILPQVQTIRDILDSGASCLVVKEREYPFLLTKLKGYPDIVVCDSQVVLEMVANTPTNVKCTTFSILFARYKGDLIENVKGALTIERLKTGDKVLIAEACSHHPIEDDIGRVKIPRWLRQYIGGDIKIDVYAGRDYPESLKEYKLIIHCGGCMLTRREVLFRIQQAKEEGVPITNYGVCISFLQGVLERALSPFPFALETYRKERLKQEVKK
ncbi:[FeFe] hydrogenase H-cluster maturation GTPase HydF [bacterium]|nr:[FeFe] hydrogenase H-cluster maturation GTPase HydF [bacterium]